MVGFWRVAVFAALFPCLAAAQDVTLTSRDGALAIAGTLQGYDGEFFRIDSAYGALTVDASGVICDGPACPDLTAPKAVIRLVGEADAGGALLPPLIAAFAKARCIALSPTMAGAPRRARIDSRHSANSMTSAPPATWARTSGLKAISIPFAAASHAAAMASLNRYCCTISRATPQ